MEEVGKEQDYKRPSHYKKAKRAARQISFIYFFGVPLRFFVIGWAYPGSLPLFPSFPFSYSIFLCGTCLAKNRIRKREGEGWKAHGTETKNKLKGIKNK